MKIQGMDTDKMTIEEMESWITTKKEIRKQHRDAIEHLIGQIEEQSKNIQQLSQEVEKRRSHPTPAQEPSQRAGHDD